MSTTRSMGREIGTALAVLAIYLLVLLAPLHHARASQLALDALGYTTVGSGWALCTPAGATGEDRHGAALAKCPATGIGKDDAVLPSLAFMPLAFSRVALAAPTQVYDHPYVPASTLPPSGPRGPPLRI